MQFYSFFNSLMFYWVCIVLVFKGLFYEILLVNICIDEYCVVGYVEYINLLVGVLVFIDGEMYLSQLFVIIDYFDVCYFVIWFILCELLWCVCVLELVNVIVCDIYFVNNLCVLCYLQDVLEVLFEQKDVWYCYWIDEGMFIVECLFVWYGVGFWCFGELFMLVDVMFVLQMVNVLCMGCLLEWYEWVMVVYEYVSVYLVFKVVVLVQ